LQKTEAARQRANIQNNIWDKGKDGMKQLIEYVNMKEHKKKEKPKKKNNNNNENE
jgi:hypothetical protein